ncbi:MAG: branched-chain amino acid ABC transporter permease [Synergistaceae bacterium]|nr:branched-chain amino acid ABC transporter permease [Synergistaceae bacterium]
MFLRLMIGSLLLGGIYGLLALSYSIIYRASGLMNFAQGDMFMVGAFIGLVLNSFLKIPYIAAVLLTMAIMFVMGLLVEKIIIRPIINRRSPAMFIVLATLALSIILRNGVMVIFSGAMFSFPPIFGRTFIQISGVKFMPEQLMAVGASILCMVMMHFFMTRTKLGTAMRGAAQDPLAAKSCGINVSLTTGITWGLSGAVAALAGILYGPSFQVFIMMGNIIGTRAFSSAVIGGYGNMYGAIAGGFLLAIVETFSAAYISSEFKDFISFAILMMFLFLKPTGIFNERALGDTR